MTNLNFSVLMSIYVKETPSNLDSCFESLHFQSVQANEIILVLDGPIGDGLLTIIDKWSLLLPIEKICLEDNVGLGQALNIGLKHCTHELVARMDTDDIALTNRFVQQLSCFSQDSSLSICGSFISEFDDEPQVSISTRTLPIAHDSIYKGIAWANPFNHMTVMYRKSHIVSVGGYQDLPWMEDWYLWTRLLAKGYKAYNIPEVLVLARTGLNMIQRRSGFSYVKSEWLMSKVKVSLKICCWPKALLIFIVRSLPRFLPKRILYLVYLCSRKYKHN
ncbi:glycosyltransferase [Shewanella putrefaciens]|uniref:glycosyltransferase n=1 Tax=Shewanella putrefaciens TaxID=24 RepID=UPI003D7A2B9C